MILFENPAGHTWVVAFIAEILNSFFAANGFEYPGGPVSDGLTVWTCVNGWIHDNDFQDNAVVLFWRH